MFASQSGLDRQRSHQSVSGFSTQQEKVIVLLASSWRLESRKLEREGGHCNHLVYYKLQHLGFCPES